MEASPLLSTGKSFQMIRRCIIETKSFWFCHMLRPVDPNMIQGLFAVCTFLLQALCDNRMLMLKLRHCVIGLDWIVLTFQISFLCSLWRPCYYYPVTLNDVWTYIPPVWALNDIGKFVHPWNSEGQQPKSLMVVVVVCTCSGTDSWRRKASARYETADSTCWVWRFWGTTDLSWLHLSREDVIKVF
jgi:hypothetical protein